MGLILLIVQQFPVEVYLLYSCQFFMLPFVMMFETFPSQSSQASRLAKGFADHEYFCHEGAEAAFRRFVDPDDPG